jgi:hypothetical protein
MINDLQADRIAAAVNAVRPEWPLASIKTLIVRDLSGWPWLDLLVGLVYVAGERNADGSWTSRTPGRVKEQGPWRTVGVSYLDDQARREKDARDAEARRKAIELRRREVEACALCDADGRLTSGVVCAHDPALPDAAHRGAAAAREALARARADRFAAIGGGEQ